MHDVNIYCSELGQPTAVRIREGLRLQDPPIRAHDLALESLSSAAILNSLRYGMLSSTRHAILVCAQEVAQAVADPGMGGLISVYPSSAEHPVIFFIFHACDPSPFLQRWPATRAGLCRSEEADPAPLHRSLMASLAMPFNPPPFPEHLKAPRSVS